MKTRLLILAIFSIAFGFVEAAVVLYLRKLLGFELGYSQMEYHQLINLGFIAFVTTGDAILRNTHVTTIELLREFSTIVMLLSIAYLSGKTVKQKIGAFLLAFSIWDIFYYIFLKVLLGWPKSVWDIDVYFLIPVAWVGPVLTPLIISSVLFIIGLKLSLQKSSNVDNDL